MDHNEAISKVVVAAFSSAAFWGIVKAVLKNLKWKKQKDLINGIKSVRRVYELINETLNFGDRSILFFGHDSGGIPKAASPFFVSALHWATLSKEKSITSEEFQKVPVDMEYITMLLNAKESRYVEIRTAELRDCILKDYYEAEGIKHAIFCFVGIRDNKFFFLTVTRFDDRPFEDNDITKICFKAQQITNEVMS